MLASGYFQLYTSDMTTTTDLIDLDGDFYADIAYGTPVSDTVCNALVSRDGVTHYVPDSEHEYTAYVLGFASLDVALNAGFVYVSLTGQGYVEARRHTTDAQVNALWTMYGVAMASPAVRTDAFCRAFRAFADEQGLA